MDKDLQALLEQYKDYTGLFAKQIYNQELWHEQTGCDIDEYFGYVSCCEARLYDFSTWYEHTFSLEYPSGHEWDFYKTHKLSLLTFSS